LRVLVTGSRNWTDRAAVAQALSSYCGLIDDVIVVHGDARGADSWADAVARERGWIVERHPAEWDLYGKSAGHRRNAHMVSLGADVCLAFPLGESRGTRGCMKLAKIAGIPVINCGN
jgi:hypothetical protein